ncbi:MAG: hypothetical protein M0T74_01420 [Desulfitobacterium hafniense]|nr:hypothetical protein [Desulfitobacterium hafniense]
MSGKGLLTVSALIGVCAIWGIAYVIVPDRLWSNTSISAAIFFSFAFGYIFFSPVVLPKGKIGKDAPIIGAIGPTSVLVTSLVGWAGLTFVLSFLGHDKITWVMIILGVSGFIISTLVLRVAAGIIDKTASQTAGPSSRTMWKSEIDALLCSTDDAVVISALSNLSEKIQFSASALPKSSDIINLDIDSAITNLRQSLESERSSSNLQHVLSNINHISLLLDRRESILMSLRNKS